MLGGLILTKHVRPVLALINAWFEQSQQAIWRKAGGGHGAKVRIGRRTSLIRRTKMEWEFVVALILMVPVMLLPVAFIWYLNLGGIYAAVRGTRKKVTVEETAVH